MKIERRWLTLPADKTYITFAESSCVNEEGIDGVDLADF